MRPNTWWLFFPDARPDNSPLRKRRMGLRQQMVTIQGQYGSLTRFRRDASGRMMVKPRDFGRPMATVKHIDEYEELEFTVAMHEQIARAKEEVKEEAPKELQGIYDHMREPIARWDDFGGGTITTATVVSGTITWLKGNDADRD
jgi:hypothetical protein